MSFIVKVPSGSHQSNPSTLSSFTAPGVMEADVKFLNSCVYNHGNSNQADWNKLLGFASGFFFQTDSARWGWRYDLNTGNVEVAPFIHSGGSFILPSPSQWIQVPLNSWAKFQIIVDRTNSRYIFNYNVSGTVTQFIIPISGLGSLYSGSGYNELQWFGGNQVAPHDVEIEYDNKNVIQCKKMQVYSSVSWRVSFTDLDGYPASEVGSPGQTKYIGCRAGTMVATMGSPTITDVGNY